MRRSRSWVSPMVLGMVLGTLLTGLVLPFVVSDPDRGPDTVSTGSAGTGTAVGDAVGSGAAVAPGAPEGGISAAAPTPLDPAGADATPSPVPGGQAPTRAAPSTAASPLTASDRGVTPSRISLGFLLLDVGPVGRAGVNVAIDTDQQRAAIKAFVDEINGRGGIHGRSIEPYFREYDALSDADQGAACRQLTEDNQVFAVFGGFPAPANNLCLVEEHKTPLFSTWSTNPDWVLARAEGRYVSTYAATGRQMAAMVAEMGRVGLLSKRIGLLGDDTYDPGGRIAAGVARLLEQRGGRVVYRGQLNYDQSVAVSQIPVEANKAKTANAEVMVMLTSNAIKGTQFVDQAERQRYRPLYVNSDYAGNNSDTANQNMPAGYEGALAFTVTRGLMSRQPPPGEPPSAARCRQIYEKLSGRKLAKIGTDEYGLTIHNCDLLRIFEAGAISAGPTLTRPALSSAVQRLGAIELAFVGPGSFGQGKWDYANSVRTQRWRASCRCWTRVDDFHRPGG